MNTRNGKRYRIKRKGNKYFVYRRYLGFWYVPITDSIDNDGHEDWGTPHQIDFETHIPPEEWTIFKVILEGNPENAPNCP